MTMHIATLAAPHPAEERETVMNESIEMTEHSDRREIRQDSEYWTIVFAGRRCVLPDTVGLHHLAYLLHHPGEEVSSLFLEQLALRFESAPRIERHAPVHCPDARERARLNVERAIDAVLVCLADYHPPLARHLAATIEIGTFCKYTPGPGLPIEWS
jgi:hypothetical protein